jgi:hypothetical protein
LRDYIIANLSKIVSQIKIVFLFYVHSSNLEEVHEELMSGEFAGGWGRDMRSGEPEWEWEHGWGRMYDEYMGESACMWVCCLSVTGPQHMRVWVGGCRRVRVWWCVCEYE